MTKVSFTNPGQREHANVVVSKPSVVAHTCTPNIHPPEAGGLLQVHGQPGLLNSELSPPKKEKGGGWGYFCNNYYPLSSLPHHSLT